MYIEMKGNEEVLFSILLSSYSWANVVKNLKLEFKSRLTCNGS